MDALLLNAAYEQSLRTIEVLHKRSEALIAKWNAVIDKENAKKEKAA